MNCTERVGLPQAAAEIGCCPQLVREKMKNGSWDLGLVETTGGTRRKYTYIIFRAKLNRFLGKET